YLLHAIDIVVATADNADDGLAFDRIPVIIECGDAECTGGFDHDSVLVVQLEDGGADAAFGCGGHFIEYFAADGVREIADAFDGGAVDEAVDIVECYGMAGAESCDHGGGSFGFDADDLRLRGIGFKIRADAGSEATSADGNKEVVYVLEVFEDLYGDGALAFDDAQVFERRDEG